MLSATRARTDHNGFNVNTLLMISQGAFTLICLSAVRADKALGMLNALVLHQILEAQKPLFTLIARMPFVPFHMLLQRLLILHSNATLPALQTFALCGSLVLSHMQVQLGLLAKSLLAHIAAQTLMDTTVLYQSLITGERLAATRKLTLIRFVYLVLCKMPRQMWLSLEGLATARKCAAK